MKRKKQIDFLPSSFGPSGQSSISNPPKASHSLSPSPSYPLPSHPPTPPHPHPYSPPSPSGTSNASAECSIFRPNTDQPIISSHSFKADNREHSFHWQFFFGREGFEWCTTHLPIQPTIPHQHLITPQYPHRTLPPLQLFRHLRPWPFPNGRIRDLRSMRR